MSTEQIPFWTYIIGPALTGVIGLILVAMKQFGKTSEGQTVSSVKLERVQLDINDLESIAKENRKRIEGLQRDLADINVIKVKIEMIERELGRITNKLDDYFKR